MSDLLCRRQFLTMSALALPIMTAKAGNLAAAVTNEVGAKSATEPASVPDPGELFPTQPPELARETVLVSHFNLKRVKELVGARPSLAKATWDWGFGDWESALGAASHMGNRAIAEYLLANGAHPSLFSATMLGQLEVVKGFVAAQPGIQRTPGPHSISLLAHAKAGGESARPVYEYLKSLGDADAPQEASLSDSDRDAILGTYIFGSSPTEQVDVTFEKERLTWTRKGTMGRWLFHLGDRVFYPSGASAVRIRFTDKDGALLMTVSDPDVVLVGKMNKRAEV
jgi:hypothetical protein